MLQVLISVFSLGNLQSLVYFIKIALQFDLAINEEDDNAK